MRCMYKYEIRGEELSLPKGAKIRYAGSQNSKWYLWAEVDTDAMIETRTFRVFGTGEPIPHMRWKEWEWIATWQDGSFVWHLFECV